MGVIQPEVSRVFRGRFIFFTSFDRDVEIVVRLHKPEREERITFSPTAG